MSWNDENKMTAFGTALSAAYRPDGLRAYKSNGTTTTYFIYDQNGVPVQEIVGGSVSAVNTFGPNGLISRNGSSDVFYQFDERGDTVDRTNTSGSVLDYHGSDPYGQQYSSAAVTDPYQGFGAQWGYYFDGETGYSLLGQRYYDPAAGRFLNQDPIGFEGGINVYSYAGNNSVSGTDPTGLDVFHLTATQMSFLTRYVLPIIAKYATANLSDEIQGMYARGLIQTDTDLFRKGEYGDSRWNTIYIRPDLFEDPCGYAKAGGAYRADKLNTSAIILASIIIHENWHVNHQTWGNQHFFNSPSEAQAWGMQLTFLKVLLDSGDYDAKVREGLAEEIGDFNTASERYR